MARFDFSQIATNTVKATNTVIHVSPGILRQVAKKGLNQAQIAWRGMAAETLVNYRGPIRVQIGEKAFTLSKGDECSAWCTKQGNNLEGFGELFNLLAEKGPQVCTITPVQ